jgi:hypothetical protein
MRTTILMAIAVLVSMLLTLPGYCSDWWPVWAQAVSIGLGVAGLGTGMALILWLLSGDVHVWKV